MLQRSIRASRSMLVALVLAAGAVSSLPNAALAQVGTAITYQGVLERNGVKINSATDMRFTLFDMAQGGAPVGNQVTLNAQQVSNGLFNTELDFGVNPYTANAARWMQIEVRNPAGSGTFSPMGSRQKMTPSPFSLATRGINVNAAGNVGIGTATPRDKLSILGGALSFANGDNPVPYVGMDFDAATDALRFRTNVGGVDLNDTAMSVNRASGYVGIGTPAPENLLHLQSATNASIGIGRLGGERAEFAVAVNAGQWSTSAQPNDIVMRSRNGGRLHLQAGTGAAAITVSGNNNVGIGTPSPMYKLDVAGEVRVTVPTNDRALLISDGTREFQTYLGQDTGGGTGAYIGTISNHLLAFTTNTIVRGAISANGLFGIGTNNPTQAKLEVRGSQNANLPAGWFMNAGGSAGFAGGTLNCSIYADAHVVAPVFVAFSDARTKQIVGRSNAAHDLETIMNVEVTDYTFKDTITKGTRPNKKVIAQQVEKVYPQAVTKSTDVVPDIYKQATTADGWITLATDLRVGEKVRLIGEKEEGIHEVLEVRADGSGFRTDFSPSTDKVFVYGREVNDFMSVDYEAIAMLNVSATQELARQNLAQQKRIDALEARLQSVLATLEANQTAPKLSTAK